MKMETVEIKTKNPWNRKVILFLEELQNFCSQYNRSAMQFLSKLNRLHQEGLTDESEYDALHSSLLNVSEALKEVQKTIHNPK
jgi:hypothetical protein